MPTEIIVAVLAVVAALIGVVTALIGRVKRHEVRVESVREQEHGLVKAILSTDIPIREEVRKPKVAADPEQYAAPTATSTALLAKAEPEISKVEKLLLSVPAHYSSSAGEVVGELKLSTTRLLFIGNDKKCHIDIGYDLLDSSHVFGIEQIYPDGSVSGSRYCLVISTVDISYTIGFSAYRIPGTPSQPKEITDFIEAIKSRIAPQFEWREQHSWK